MKVLFNLELEKVSEDMEVIKELVDKYPFIKIDFCDKGFDDWFKSEVNIKVVNNVKET